MTRPKPGAFPPTPAPSTELRGKPSVPPLTTFDGTFALPPAALGAHGGNRSAKSSSTTSIADDNASDSSYRPLSPRSPVDFAASSSKSNTVAIAPSDDASRASKAPGKAKLLLATRKGTGSGSARAKQQQQQDAEYTIPPPPTRKRKIIQMNPRTPHDTPINASAGQTEHQNLKPAPLHRSTSFKANTNNVAAGGKGGTGSKRRQGNGADSKPTTAAGRKIARKTAHSLIERRRRSKMNEEFGVLKDLIPACRGQEMHKLAILQASIEYMRYLERCLKDLKAAHEKSKRGVAAQESISYPPCTSQVLSEEGDNSEDEILTARHDEDDDNRGEKEEEEEEAESEDEDMPDATPSYSDARTYNTSTPSHASYYHQSSNSPAILPSNHTSPAIIPRHSSVYQHVSHSALPSALPSPIFEAQRSNSMSHIPGSSTFSLTSPLVPNERYHVIEPVKRRPRALSKEDDEATAALMMLNSDRRSWSGESPAVGGQQSVSAASKDSSMSRVSSSRGMSVRDLLSA